MKRRNADCGKIRRPIKRNKIAEQIGSNTLLYVKFLLLWAFVITADFLLEFRFEFLWPFWLLLRSVYDSFKYKGLAFSVLFVCIAITSDLVCLFFIPVQWLFFVASTYVWVQYVWHTDKGICLPTIILWILFVYLEAAIRWKDSRNIPHLDLCRPFAAHCIGYPVVTLGFGFKSYVGYRIRQRKQREVAKDNDFYMQLLQEALPKDESGGGVGTNDVHNSSNSSSSAAAPCDQQDHQLSSPQKDVLVSSTAGATTTPAAATVTQSVTSSNNHHHHHHNSSRNAQSHNSKSQGNVTAATTAVTATTVTATSQANGHAGGGSSSATVTSSTSNGGSSAMNGGVTHSKHLHRKSLDKDTSSGQSLSGKAASYSYHQQQQQQQSSNSAKESSRSNDSAHTNGAATSPREKKDCDSTTAATPASKSQFDGVSSTTSSNHDGSGGGRNKQNQQNGHVVGYEPELQQQQSNHVESDPPVEPKASNRSGRKNRVKQKDNNATTTAASPVTSKDNHQQNHPETQQTPPTTTPAAPVVAPASSNGTPNGAAGSPVGSTVAVVPTPPVIQTVKVCETCARHETDSKKLRTEVSQLRQNENELRQKYDSNTANLKGCLQTKQRECDEMQSKYQELTAQRQQERQNLQTVERRLGEERRHKQSLESQLQNERKHRKQCEEKTSRMDQEVQKLRRDLITSEDAKHNAEKQNRNYEQELRKYEAQLRNRENQQSAEVLMSALAAMQDKNATLEKNLSAETRVKLDLFSALGETRRQLEIASGSLRTKEKEILDLKAKIVQLLAVMPAMPNDSLCLSGPVPSSSGSGSAGGSLMRLSDAPQLLSQSTLNGGGVVGGGQPSPMSHIVLNNPPLMSQLSSLGVLTPTITTSNSGPTMIPPSMQHQHQQQQQQQGMVVATAAALAAAAAAGGSNGQIVQMQNSSNCPSNLDPNASVYTPKNCSQTPVPASSMTVGGGGGGTEA